MDKLPACNLPTSKQPIVKRSVLRSFADAFRGIWFCAKSERNMRIHLTACAYLLFTAFSLDLTRLEIAVLVLMAALVISAEMLNTAVEKHCDFNQKNYCGPIRNVKDIAAGAVLMAAIGAVVVGVLILWRDSLWVFLFSFIEISMKSAVLLLTMAAAGIFIFWGPAKIAEKIRKRFTSKR